MPPQPASTAESSSTKSKVIFPAALQLSVAVGDPVAAGSVESSQLTVTFSAQTIVGAELSSIVILCSQVDTFPQSSLASQVLMKTPWLPPHSSTVPLF